MGRRWTAGDPIVFGTAAESAQATAEQKERISLRGQPRTSTPASARPPSSATRGTYSPAPSSRSSTSFARASSYSGWPAGSHRWDPPSPSPSLHSSLADLSAGSTALFDPARSYAAVPSVRSDASLLSAAGDDRAKLEVQYGSFGALDERDHGMARVEVGVQAGSPQVRGVSVLSQAEMDDLISGVDFDEALDVELDAEPSSLGVRQPRADLAPDALEELVSGIDFSQAVGLSDSDEPSGEGFHSATASPSNSADPTCEPASPQPTVPSPRIGIRTCAPPSPRPSPPQQTTDLFSPRSSALSPSRSLSLSGSPLRQSTPFLPSPAPALAAPSPRPYSTSAPSPRREDSDNELLAPDTRVGRSESDARDKGKGKVIELSDDSLASSPELVILRKQGAAFATTADKPKTGWFRRPATAAGAARSPLATRVQPDPPTSPGSSATRPTGENSAPAASSFTRSKTFPTRPVLSMPVSSRPAASLGMGGSARKPRYNAKREAEAAKQAALREKWPRVFSYKTWRGVGRAAPRVVYTTDEAEVERMLPMLEGPLGFDLEWDPYVPRTGGQGKAALVQVCSESTILLVHVAKMARFPRALKQFIEDPERIKLGVQIAGDASKLRRDFGHAPKGTLELNAVVRHYDKARFVGRVKPGLIGLQELTGIYLDAYLPKEHDVRCAKWSGKLSVEQLEYAANDVYASLYVLLAIQSLAGVSADAAAPMLQQLSVTPYNSWSGFVTARPRAPTTDAARETTYALPALPEAETDAQTPQDVLTARKFEAFTLFHHERLALDEMTARMAASNPIKPLSVVWNVLSAAARLRERGIAVEWDVQRLVHVVDEVQGASKEHMLKEHGALLDELRKELAEGAFAKVGAPNA
ncbi:hypothetical protein JCM3770_001458 [Rhodotorula araucariae]